MKITSLARQSDLIFASFEGEVIDRGTYVAIRTPSNPGYHWGNFLIFPNPPTHSDIETWPKIYREEFTYYLEIRHMTFTWNPLPESSGVIEPFIRQGFRFEKNQVLTTTSVHPPHKHNAQVQIRTLSLETDWDQAIELQVLCRDPSFELESYRIFKRKQFSTYKNMRDKGLGERFGAFVGERLVGDLGLFHKEGLGRYQNVVTHPEYRRQGICGTLVYKSGKVALNSWQVKTLVMEADPYYHAARIYQSVGFRPTEENQSLSWWIE